MKTPSRGLNGDERCPVCDSKMVRLLYMGIDKVASRYGSDTRFRVRLNKCKSCGMLFLGKADYDPERIHKAYWKMLTENLSDDYSVPTQHRKLLPKLVNDYRKTNRLFEIGCGDATLLRTFQASGWEVEGIDISEQASALAWDKYGLKVLCGQLDEKTARQLGDHSFDVVVMWGLIEHLPDPRKMLQLSRLLLRKGGALIIYTTNAKSIFYRLARISYYLSLKQFSFLMERVIIAMHYLYFSRETMRYFLQSGDLKVREIIMTDIDLDFIFKAHGHLWWSNRFFLVLTHIVQQIGTLGNMSSHMIALAEASST
ncbi:MAG: class I SAM-dependent methyltransferase [PVC group bacterium]